MLCVLSTAPMQILHAEDECTYCMVSTITASEKFKSCSEHHALCRLMCVGYGLRTLEVRFDMEQSMMLEERDAGLGYLPP